MKWKTNKEKEKDVDSSAAAAAAAVAAASSGVSTKKQSISSIQSMPFLRDDNLTFYRLATAEEPPMKFGSISEQPTAEHSVPSSPTYPTPAVDETDSSAHRVIPPANAASRNHCSPRMPTKSAAPFGSPATGKELSSFPGSVWTTNTGTLSATNPHRGDHHNSMYKNSYTIEANDFQYIPSSSAGGSLSERRKSTPQQNGSTAKLMLADDESNKQSKCSLLRGIIFCLCLNFTYANVVRFPRELERHGAAFLVPYFAILLLVGLPVILLEISLGQFLGQGSAHSWRASPILKGASVVGRLACWLGAVWTSLHAVIGVVYIGELVFKTVPFTQCVVKVRLVETTGYKVVSKDGQECLEYILQTPDWEHQLYYALLGVGLVIVWITAILCTYNSKMLRRSIFVFGISSLCLLAFLSGWNVADFINRDNGVSIAEMWPFDPAPLANSAIWFSALVQVIFSSGIGVGVWPVITGKFLYKGDAVRTSMIYMCFNVFIVTLSVAFFLTQYQNPTTLNSTITLSELKPLTAIYDAATNEADPMLARLIPGLAYLLVVFVTIISVAIAIYTTSRFFTRRRPNYILGLLGLVASAAALIGPKYIVARLLDADIVGILVIVSLIFDIMSITWIYGAKNIYTDLEFSIGRPILKVWVLMWCITPVMLTGLLTWWCVDLELFTVIPPRWSAIVLALIIIALVACMQVYRQVDYNCCSMVQEAAQSSTNWGPADPIVRHAWKQWRSVCEDTGQKDFTLRRRGTRDYTHSIKKGQYSRSKYGLDGVRKASTVGSNSPNYSGSIYDDSAIEEDVSIEKFPQTNGAMVIGQNGGDSLGKTYRYPAESHHVKKSLADVPEATHQKQYFYVQPATASTTVASGASLGDHYHNVSKVEIGKDNSVRPYAKNPLARMSTAPIPPTGINHHYGGTAIGHNHRVSVEQDSGNGATDHICWRKFAVNTDEFSTEL